MNEDQTFGAYTAGEEIDESEHKFLEAASKPHEWDGVEVDIGVGVQRGPCWCGKDADEDIHRRAEACVTCGNSGIDPMTGAPCNNCGGFE